MALIGLFYTLSNLELFGKIAIVHCFVHCVNGLGITIGSHRLWAHKSYSASFTWRVIFMLLNSGNWNINWGANQGSIYHWSRDHRLHHKFSDTDLDPHSMKRGFFFSHVGWLLVKKTPELVTEGQKIDISDLKNDPVVMFQKRHYLLLSIIMCFILPTMLYYFIAHTPLWASFCLSYLSYSILLNATWCVNSVCHMFGTRPYNSNI